MLDIKYIRDNKDKVKENVKNRNVEVSVDRLLELDDKRRAVIHQVEDLRAQRNKGSRLRPGSDGQAKGKPTEEEILQMRKVGEDIKNTERELEMIETEYRDLLTRVPNMTHPDSPIGSEEQFKVVFSNQEPESFNFTPKDHEQLMTELDVIDFERGAKVAESKFYFTKNKMVRLNQALLNYGMDVLEKHGYILIETPDMAKSKILEGIGFNPRGEETQVYNVANTELSLIGTAEITMGGYHSDEVLDLSKGPIKYAAVSHCFRTEAGAYGRTSKGLFRVHQFSKLEMFDYCKPEDSEMMHQEILNIEKEIADGLEIPYRVIDIPTGDLGGPAYRKFDIEAWMIMKAEDGKQGGYGEITSTSNCTDYQARRLNIKYKKDDGSSEFVHTLNGTAVVLSRFPIALFENHQQADGSVKIPKTLHKYTGFTEIKN